jgi:hypothetical protein
MLLQVHDKIYCQETEIINKTWKMYANCCLRKSTLPIMTLQSSAVNQCEKKTMMFFVHGKLNRNG